MCLGVHVGGEMGVWGVDVGGGMCLGVHVGGEDGCLGGTCRWGYVFGGYKKVGYI